MYSRKNFYTLWAGLSSAFLAVVLVACTQSSVNPPVQPPVTAVDTTRITNGFILDGCGFTQDTIAFDEVEVLSKRPADPAHADLVFAIIVNRDSNLNSMYLDMTIPTDTGIYQWQDLTIPNQQPDPTKVICSLDITDLFQQQPPEVFSPCNGSTHVSIFNKISYDSLIINGTLSGNFLDENGDTLKLTNGVFSLNFH